MSNYARDYSDGNWTLYCHINKINGKKYIGITSKKNPNSRWRNGKGYENAPHFWHAIQKYGWGNFEHVILSSTLTKERACELEKLLISHLKLQDENYGYNFGDGGNTGNSMRGERHPMYGRHHTKESNEKNRQAHLGRRFNLSQEAKDKIRKASMGNTNGKTTPVICNETGRYYHSAAEAQRDTGADASAIIKCIKGKLHKTHGYTWKAG